MSTEFDWRQILQYASHVMLVLSAVVTVGLGITKDREAAKARDRAVVAESQRDEAIKSLHKSSEDSIAATSALNVQIGNLLTSNENLNRGNAELRASLAPFTALAEQRFPDIDTAAALKRLQHDLEQLDKRTAPTVLIPTGPIEEIQSDGSVKYMIRLTPVGIQPIPIFRFACQTKDKTKIRNVNFSGPTLPFMSTVSNSDDTWIVEYRTLSPGTIDVSIITEKKALGMNIDIS
jgi:hypothetical protein